MERAFFSLKDLVHFWYFIIIVSSFYRTEIKAFMYVHIHI